MKGKLDWYKILSIAIMVICVALTILMLILI